MSALSDSKKKMEQDRVSYAKNASWFRQGITGSPGLAVL
jgi:hypothetical protein